MGIPIFLSNIAVQSSYSKQAMTLQILNRQNSLLNTFLNEIRNVELQNDRMRFRRNLERVGEIMAYEISKTFSYVLQTIKTPINPAEVNLPARDIVIATVLRAGLPFHQGFLNYFDRAESAFISARRKKQWKCVSTPFIHPDSTGKYCCWSTRCWQQDRLWSLHTKSCWRKAALPSIHISLRSSPVVRD